MSATGRPTILSARHRRTASASSRDAARWQASGSGEDEARGRRGPIPEAIAEEVTTGIVNRQLARPCRGRGGGLKEALRVADLSGSVQGRSTSGVCIIGRPRRRSHEHDRRGPAPDAASKGSPIASEPSIPGHISGERRGGDRCGSVDRTCSLPARGLGPTSPAATTGACRPAVGLRRRDHVSAGACQPSIHARVPRKCLWSRSDDLRVSLGLLPRSRGHRDRRSLPGRLHERGSKQLDRARLATGAD